MGDRRSRSSEDTMEDFWQSEMQAGGPMERKCARLVLRLELRPFPEAMAKRCTLENSS